jgi:hypothetical protein
MIIKIENGKLLCDGQEIKPEFGNCDHIKAINDAIELEEKFKDSVSIGKIKETTDSKYDDEYWYKSKFKCKCGQQVSMEIGYYEEKLTENELLEEFSDRYADCKYCDQEYHILLHNDKLRACPE